jgi:hypothetical protein
MIMSPRTRKLMLTAHVTTSISWCGALAVFLAHSLVALASQDEQVVRAMSIAMGLTAWLVIMPLSLATLATGLTQALGSAWGLVRHYWVLFKLVLTAVATIVLLLKLGPIGALADAAAGATFSSSDHIAIRTSLAFHAAAGLAILLAAAVLAIYKPAGLVRRDSSDSGGLPAWVMVCGGIIVLLILLVGAMMLGGGHGPGIHA